MPKSNGQRIKQVYISPLLIIISMFKTNPKKILAFCLLLLFYALPAAALMLKNPLGSDKLQGEAIWGRIIKAILGFAGVGALVSFILAGVFFLFSAGNPERVKKARETMLYAALGLMILLGSYAITNFILSAIVGEFKFDQPVTPAQTQ